ncbi:nucleotidyltransferase family protein [Arthrobacter sp. CAU 1506]|uniref:nucleotidyltransferase family protein n=1 Tax=Arthrobacter sp. CAU 1506 TaxID=2560052 RepID=UPI0010AD6D04|nr:nucleotidyltransferase family protein [Arthrobacter sp. CAU 1506]TJY68870.1 nucleotidyltransferase family protein [Arthrobacter sp. CAU 1506]
MKTPVHGVLLAAGAGRRLGLGPKALLAGADGVPLVRKAAEVLRHGGCASVAVVLGAGAAEVHVAADLAGCSVLVNEQWSEGMAGSLRLGVQSALPDQAVLIALVDQPGISPELVARLIDAAQPGRIIAAGYRSPEGKLRRGHPVLFAPSLAARAAEQATGDAGARPFLSAHPELVELVDCSDLSDGGDIDTPADLGRLR